MTHFCGKVIIDQIHTRVHVDRVRKGSITRYLMPKTTKRAETKRAARIARAHATELPKQPVKNAPSRRSPGYHPPRHGPARHPLGIGILLVAASAIVTYALYVNHLWPFTPPPVAKSPCVASAILKKVTDTTPAPDQTAIDQTTHKYDNAPAISINTSKLYCAGINTNRGLIVVELDPKLAPNTVNNFVFLAQNHFYDGLKFHRVIPNDAANAGQIHIIQGGDPQGDGKGGPGYQFNDEPVTGEYKAGTIAMANSGANTNGSQFFINTTENKQLPKNYNLFGHVVQGLDIAQKIQGPGDSDTSKNITPDVMNHVIVVPAP